MKIGTTGAAEAGLAEDMHAVTLVLNSRFIVFRPAVYGVVQFASLGSNGLNTRRAAR